MRRILLFIFLALVPALSSFGQGVFVYKQQNFHKDEDAYAFEYTKVEIMPPIVWVTVAGKRIRFEKHVFHQWLAYPNSDMPSIATGPEIQSYRKTYQDVVDFYNRFPKSRPFLETRLRSMKERVSNLDEGYVLLDNEWISKAEYEQRELESKLAAERQQEEIERMERERIKRQLESKRQEEEKTRKEMEMVEAKREAIREERIGGLQAQIAEKRREIDELNKNISSNAERLNRILP